MDEVAEEQNPKCSYIKIIYKGEKKAFILNKAKS